MAGLANPPPDPLSEDVKYFTDLGYDDKDARAFAGFMQRKLSPLQQENQRLQAANQGTFLAEEIMQHVSTQNAEMFADPEINNKVYADLRRFASTGKTEGITPALAVELAIGYWAQRTEPWKRNQPGNTPPPPSNIRPFTGSFAGPQPGYAPTQPAPNPNAITPEARKMAEEMARSIGHTLPQAS